MSSMSAPQPRSFVDAPTKVMYVKGKMEKKTVHHARVNVLYICQRHG